MYVINNSDVVCRKEEKPEWLLKTRRWQRTKSCSGYSWRNQFFHNVNQAKRLESLYKTDYELKVYFKEYHIQTNILNHTDLPEAWWDEKIRRTEGCWKFQYKISHQYNVRSRARDSKSIRMMILSDEYNSDDVDLMLEKEFILSETNKEELCH